MELTVVGPHTLARTVSSAANLKMNFRSVAGPRNHLKVTVEPGSGDFLFSGRIFWAILFAIRGEGG